MDPEAVGSSPIIRPKIRMRPFMVVFLILEICCSNPRGRFANGKDACRWCDIRGRAQELAPSTPQEYTMYPIIRPKKMTMPGKARLASLFCYSEPMNKFLIYIIASFVSLFIITPAVFAAKPTAPSKTPLGIDVSWPQCGRTLPTNHAFGIVGVNNGYANQTNPCLTTQLAWAQQAIGGTNQELVQLYVNTANPGGYNTPSWPTVATAPNPYACDGSDSVGCAWQYGWNRALEDAKERFEPAAVQAGLVKTSASEYIWWLDVETDNTWKLSGSSFDTQSNVAVLEGMTAYFRSIGARVGIYALGTQWKQIVGNAVTPESNLNGLPNWRPGGASLGTARDACNAVPLTLNGKVVLTQFVSKNLDYNYSCPL